MASFMAKVIANRRITIPRNVATDLDIHEGDHVLINDLTKLVPEKEATP